MSHIETGNKESKSHLKMRDLAYSCGWVAAVLEQQDRILEQVDLLSMSRDSMSWGSGWSDLRDAIGVHFNVGEAVLAPAVRAMRQRAHALAAEVRRQQIRREVDELRGPSWDREDGRLRRLREILACHFGQEESWSLASLACHHDDRANASLTARCKAALLARSEREGSEHEVLGPHGAPPSGHGCRP